ncbi:TetR family transcriptional regulator [Murinocardiopsis flavida]|uniref:TetR family transcriptional regulator n=1 Tax=Murinocardiopsis flavida TaxID=645275 RepID=A0A2P8DF93_9ACTN|nr:TetR/AcrR family transcriptional regulator [Murinocardiopsis flavida]PSK95878.1 TetR family transcriptional regulator [Murinocardiopsis flavida]
MPIRTEQDRTRREKAADGAIAVIAESGLRGLTHRAVDARTALPPGTASSCFRTRQALIDAALGRIIELDEAILDQLPPDWWRTPERAAETLTALLETWLGEARHHTRARMVLYLDASLAQHNEALYKEASLRFLGRAAEAMREVGFPAPERTAGVFVSQLDGILFGALARPFHPAADRAWLREAVEAVLRSLGTGGAAARV